jgi:hypothetical protein
MNKKVIEEVKQHLSDINKTIASLDPAIRGAAFNILAPYYFDEISPPSDDKKTPPAKKQLPFSDTASIEKFFATHEHNKPSDNVFLIAAWLYSQHGITPLTAALCDEISSQIGITVPSRADNSMRTAKRKGKSLFKQQGKGWVLTISGEQYVKETYGVRKGNKPLPEAA